MRFNLSFSFFFNENRTCVPAAGRMLFSFKDLLHYRSEPAVFWFSSSLSLQHQSTDHQQQSRCTSKIIKTLSGVGLEILFWVLPDCEDKRIYLCITINEEYCILPSRWSGVSMFACLSSLYWEELFTIIGERDGRVIM